MTHFALALFSNSTINFTSLAVPLWKGSYRLFAMCVGRGSLLLSIICFHFDDINYMKMNSQAGENRWFISPCHESFSSQRLHFICFKLFFSPTVNKSVMPPTSDYCGGILSLHQNNQQESVTPCSWIILTLDKTINTLYHRGRDAVLYIGVWKVGIRWQRCHVNSECS